MTPNCNAIRALRIVDAHHHFWQLGRFPYQWLAPDAPARPFGDHSAIKRDFLPGNYREAFAGHELVASVHVQANCGASDLVEETRWLSEMAVDEGLPSAIVAEVDLCRPDVAVEIDRHAAYPAMRGVRAMPAWDANGRWRFANRARMISEPAFRIGVKAVAERDLSLDLVVVPEQLTEVAQLAQDHPHLRIAVNHMALLEPQVHGNVAQWHAGLASIEPYPQVRLKLSGLWTIDKAWRAERLAPFVRAACDILGSGRLMYGSNYPVESISAGIDTQLEALVTCLSGRPSRDLDAIFSGTAIRHYALA